MRKITKIFLIGFSLFNVMMNSACTLASPFDRLVAAAAPPATEPVRTLQPTFTATPVSTPTPTKTATPTVTPIPTDTPTPLPPTGTPTPLPTDTPTITPTNTPAPPPPPTNTPGPTDTPVPSWDYKLAERFSAPTNATILSIVVAIQNNDNSWIPGLRVVGIDPNGVVTKSEPSADRETGHTPANSSVIKSGNTKFEPQPKAIYITGPWTFHLETVDGKQVSPSFTVNMDAENREWHFFRFTP